MSQELEIVNDETSYPDLGRDITIYGGGIKPYHVRSHDFTFASIDATARMLDVWALLFSEMSEQDWYDKHGNAVTPSYYFKSDKLKKWFGITKSEALSSTLRTPARRLATTSVGIYRKDSGEFAYFPLFQEISYKKGVLKITPNASLRASYIIKAGDSAGFAKVDNRIYRALKASYSKRLFEMLCRFRIEVSSLYPISIERLQKQLGIIDQYNRVIVNSYSSPITFVTRVIKPALIAISKSKEAEGVLEIMTSKSGELGYEIVDADTSNPKVLFHCKWITEYSDEEVLEALKRVIDLTTELKNMRANKVEPSIDMLLDFKRALQVSGREDEAEKVDCKIKEMKASIAIKKQLKEEDKKNKMAERVSQLLDGGFFDGIL